jgi:BirA family transcriptional regulator, biotin operon repressor / biotin---[acetyl-CoA-carboxylase] ligase
VERHVPARPVTLKWPNDLLVGDRKAAGILVEQHAGAVVVGLGLNVDWRGVERPAALAGATSLAEGAAASGAGAAAGRGGAPAEAGTGGGVVAAAGRGGAPAEAGTGGGAGAAAGRGEAPAASLERWRIFAGLVGVLGNRYAGWRADPVSVLPAYRARCSTLGRRVRVERPGGPLEGHAEAVADSGALVIRDDVGARVHVAAGDVTHLRPAG